MRKHDAPPLKRFRVPAALAVAFVASSTAVTMWYGGCQASSPEPEPPDAGRLEGMITDAQTLDPDADIDAGAPDAPRDAAIDAPEPVG